MTNRVLIPMAGRRAGRRDIAALEAVRDHPSPLVQNRVGDALREAARTQPDLVAATCARWLEESPCPATTRIVRRALRAVHERAAA